MAAEGAAVVVNYASSKAGADAAVERITQKDGRAVAVQADLSKPEDIQRLFAEAKKAFGKIDILVNNAGVYEFAPLEAITPEHFHKQYNLNVLGLLLATQEAVKHFGPEGGSVVNISSVAATMAPPNASVYSGTKAAVNAITKSLASGVGTAQDPRQRHQPRHGRNRRASMRRVLSTAISRKGFLRKLRSDASANRRISPRRPCSSPRRIPPGSPARPCTSPAAFAESIEASPAAVAGEFCPPTANSTRPTIDSTAAAR